MSKSRFFEGLIIGTIIGYIGSMMILQNEQVESKEDEESQENDNESKESVKRTVNTENVVSKTLEAIEQGFDKLSKMVEDKKDSNAQEAIKTK